MREYVPSVPITPDALEGSPYTGQGRKEAKEPAVRRVTFFGVGESACVDTEEKFNIARGVCKRAEHVTEEEVAKFDWIYPGCEKTPL